MYNVSVFLILCSVSYQNFFVKRFFCIVLEKLPIFDGVVQIQKSFTKTKTLN